MKTDTIEDKLLQFQRQNITLEKDGKNPHFKSSYATLNEVLAKVKKPLNDLGILIIQSPEEKGLKTTLLDVQNGGKVECFVPYADFGTPQKLGANLTYFRRYSLIALLGLEDEDLDGELPQTTKKSLSSNEFDI